MEQLLSGWKGLGELRDEGVFAKAKPHELSRKQEEVIWTSWHPGWVPFAQEGGGNLYCMDLEPGPEGTRGQVIGWELHGGPLRPRAASLEEFFGQSRRVKLKSSVSTHWPATLLET
ncbi:MAG TPA: SMI1/KNR4 family protein [Archangium sp.]|nr:SMI1/KNR4 family protein [Archangium sp.]